MKPWRLGLVVGVLLLAALPPSVGTAASGAQVAHVQEATYADGGTDLITFKDGSTRSFHALFVVPRSGAVASGGATGADLTKPWAAFHVMSYGGETGDGVACSLFTNVDRWSDLVDGPPVAGPLGPERTVGGLQFTVSCPNDRFYTSYVVTYDTAILGGRPSTVGQMRKPEPTYETWSAKAPVGANGVLQANVETYQGATMTVCGLRHDNQQECLKPMVGGAQIYPRVTNLGATAYAL